MKFQTTLLRFGEKNTGIEVPEDILTALGRGRRVKVVATVNGYTYRTSVAHSSLGPRFRGQAASPDRREGVLHEIVGDLVADDRTLHVGRPEMDPGPDSGVEDFLEGK
jgi:hypothetical protein